jgi:hypothetical protein
MIFRYDVSVNHFKEIQLENILVTDEAEVDAVKYGEIEGDVYSDGEVWADVVSLLMWREAHIQREAA